MLQASNGTAAMMRHVSQKITCLNEQLITCRPSLANTAEWLILSKIALLLEL